MNPTIENPIPASTPDSPAAGSQIWSGVDAVFSRLTRFQRAGVLIAVGLQLAALCGMIVQQANFFLFFISSFIGGAVGQAILWATKGRRGKKVEILTGVTMVVGTLLSTLLTGVWRYYFHAPIGAVWFLIGLALCTGAAIARVRY